MSRVRNTMKLIEKAAQFVNDRYSLCLNNVGDIKKASTSEIDLITNGFYFGYMQGMKAAKAEMRKVQ